MWPSLRWRVKLCQPKKKEQKSRGLGNTPNRASSLTPDEEEQMWATGALGDSDPEALIHTMWFLMTKCYGFRGCHESRQLEWGDVSLKFNGDNSPYLQWNERLTKTRAGTGDPRAFAPKMFQNTKHPDRCPMGLYVSGPGAQLMENFLPFSWAWIPTSQPHLLPGLLMLPWVKIGWHRQPRRASTRQIH